MVMDPTERLEIIARSIVNFRKYRVKELAAAKQRQKATYND